MEKSTQHIEKRIAGELLVLRCQDGELDAFRELVDHWQSRLLRFVYRLTEDRDASADVTQECWMAVVRGIRRLDDPSLFRAWLFRIAANKCADWVRRVQRTRRTNEELIIEVESTLVDLECDSTVSDSIDEIKQLRQALRKLPPEQRKILKLRYLESIKTDEIAQLLGVPAGTVKSRLYHARNSLRALIDKYNNINH